MQERVLPVADVIYLRPSRIGDCRVLAHVRHCAMLSDGIVRELQPSTTDVAGDDRDE